MRRLTFLLIGLLWVLPGPQSALAGDVLQRIPENCLGFVLVNNLSEASEKFEQLQQPFGLTFPAPLSFGKIITGLDEGLDSAGELVITILPSFGNQAAVQPMVLLPVSDYEAFAESINADASGEICRVTLLGEDILVARDGQYAMLMNVEHRSMMEELIVLDPAPMAALTPIADWLPDNDLTVVVMQPGIEYLSNQKPQRRRRFGAGYEFRQSHSIYSQLLAELSGPQMREWLQSNVEFVALGLSVDQHTNVKIGKQLVLKGSSSLPESTLESPPQQTAQLGLTSEPCVFTAGGPIAKSWGQKLAGFLRQSEQSQAAATGLKRVPPELWEREEEAFGLLLKDLRSCSVVMLPGEKGEPLLGNFMAVVTMADVNQYFRGLPKVIETWNEITQLSTGDIKPEFELKQDKIAGKPAREIVVDIASTARDANTPAFNWMLESALGPTGKLRVQFVEVDETTCIVSMATVEQISTLLKVMKDYDASLPAAQDMQTTLKLLDPAAPWKALVRPQGCLKWTSRVIGEFLAPFSSQSGKFPAMSAAAPIGVSVNNNGRRWESEVVLPAQTWKTIGQFVQAIDDPFGDF